MASDAINEFASAADDLVILAELIGDLIGSAIEPDMAPTPRRLLIQADAVLLMAKTKAETMRADFGVAYRAACLSERTPPSPP